MQVKKQIYLSFSEREHPWGKFSGMIKRARSPIQREFDESGRRTGDFD